MDTISKGKYKISKRLGTKHIPCFKHELTRARKQKKFSNKRSHGCSEKYQVVSRGSLGLICKHSIPLNQARTYNQINFNKRNKRGDNKSRLGGKQQNLSFDFFSVGGGGSIFLLCGESGMTFFLLPTSTYHLLSSLSSSFQLLESGGYRKGDNNAFFGAVTPY